MLPDPLRTSGSDNDIIIMLRNYMYFSDQYYASDIAKKLYLWQQEIHIMNFTSDQRKVQYPCTLNQSLIIQAELLPIKTNNTALPII